MACEYLWNDVQEVALYSPILFRSSIPCNRGLVIHEDETGNFILRGANTGNCCNRWTHYQVTFNGNIAIPEGGAVVPIAIALSVNGEPRYVSRAIFTPAAAEDYGNVTSTAIIKVPRCCCYSLGVEAVPATTDPTVTPAPLIEVQNANLTISRVA
jgi:hypothetical protein